jgi:hypothetical protein
MAKILFEKGNNGKPKGATNKVTQEARELFLQTLEAQVPNIMEAFNQVREKNPVQYLDLFQKYAQYFVPKKTSLEGGDKPLDINFDLKEVIKFKEIDNT